MGVRIKKQQAGVDVVDEKLVKPFQYFVFGPLRYFPCIEFVDVSDPAKGVTIILGGIENEVLSLEWAL